MAQVCTDFGARLAPFNGAEDRFTCSRPTSPKVALCHLVNSLKGVSSRHLRQNLAGSINPAATGGRF